MEGKVSAYFGDLIISAKDEVENLQNLEEVLSTASKYGLIINWKKCNLLVKLVEYLDYVMRNGTIAPAYKKIQAVVKFSKLLTTEAEVFLA